MLSFFHENLWSSLWIFKNTIFNSFLFHDWHTIQWALKIFSWFLLHIHDNSLHLGSFISFPQDTPKISGVSQAVGYSFVPLLPAWFCRKLCPHHTTWIQKSPPHRAGHADWLIKLTIYKRKNVQFVDFLTHYNERPSFKTSTVAIASSKS